MASGGGISLEEAIKSKYGGGSAEQDAGAVRESAVYLRPSEWPRGATRAEIPYTLAEINLEIR